MNVNTLHLLGKPSAPSVMVRPCVQGQLQAPVMVSVPELTALTSELVFRLKAKPRNEIVERVDLLDFPGYRRCWAHGSTKPKVTAPPSGRATSRACFGS